MQQQISADGVRPPKTSSNSFEWPGNGKASNLALPLELLILLGAGILAAGLHQSFRLPLRLPGYHGIEWLAILTLARLISTRPGAGMVTGLGAATAALVYAGGFGFDGKSAQMLTYILQGCILDALIFKSRITFSAFIWVPLVGAVVHMISPLVKNTFVSLGSSALNFGSLLNGISYPLMTHALFGATGSALGLLIYLGTRKKQQS